jgi:hypothetical protein
MGRAGFGPLFFGPLSKPVCVLKEALYFGKISF